MNAVRATLRCAALLALLGSVAVSCSEWNDDVDSRSATAGLPALQLDLEAHEWLLDGPASTPPVRGGDRSITIRFRGDTVSGNGPCNSYHGQVSIGGDDVEITGLATTLMACAPAVMRAETRYLRALERVTTGDVNDDDDEMTLEGAGVRLRYHSFDADELIVGTWDIVNLAGRDAIQGVMAGTDPTITFHENGDLSVDTGCNVGSGSWELRGDALSIGTVALTRRLCVAPAGIDDQETTLAAALEQAATVEITPDQLTVLNDNGRIVLVASKHSKGTR